VSKVKGPRSYSSAVRDEQAARTRTRILDAAAELFLERGYGRTTVQEVAGRAGVARDTVHAAFGSKARLLTALIDTRLVPDGAVGNVTETAAAQAVKAEADPHRQIELFATWIAEMSTRLRPVFEILRTASAVEPEMGAIFDEMDRYRLKNMQTYARWFAKSGSLRVSTKRAAEIIWALASPDVARMLCDELGWSEADHARWLADTLSRSLLHDT
jgi:AcrR family transcriptional regulator